MSTNDNLESEDLKSTRIYVSLALATAVAYFFSNPHPRDYYDYTFRVATNILGGSIALIEEPPPWLNEFVSFEGVYYSVFPFGSVVSMVPFALLKVAGIINEMPGAAIAAMCAGVSCLFMFLIGKRYDINLTRRVVMVLGFLFGTWMWTNLTVGGAWQLALGFAMVGELGAIYFTVYDRRPLMAGLFFALAFGNRTEVLLTAPLFFWLLSRDNVSGRNDGVGTSAENRAREKPSRAANPARAFLRRLGLPVVNVSGIALFCIVPFVLGVLTLLYNYVRFHSFTDFGYARIPGVLSEPWYNHGIFSWKYIPRQIWEMLLRPWETSSTFPYLFPNPFSSSILWSSPFLLFAFRSCARDRALTYVSWLAVLVLCLVLWMHGNSGGWQFGYRYAMVCLPWLFVIMLETSPKKLTPLEWVTYIFAFAANMYATWLFHWTAFMKG
jgi:hypothetical protein